MGAAIIRLLHVGTQNKAVKRVNTLITGVELEHMIPAVAS
jgi:hypothetical protein